MDENNYDNNNDNDDNNNNTNNYQLNNNISKNSFSYPSPYCYQGFNPRLLRLKNQVEVPVWWWIGVIKMKMVVHM